MNCNKLDYIKIIHISESLYITEDIIADVNNLIIKTTGRLNRVRLLKASFILSSKRFGKSENIAFNSARDLLLAYGM